MALQPVLRRPIHAFDAVNHGSSRVMVRTVDTDVLILAIAGVKLHSITELWVLLLPQEKASDTSQPMRWQVLLNLRNAKPCHSYTHSVDVIQYPPFPVGVRGLCVSMEGI